MKLNFLNHIQQEATKLHQDRRLTLEPLLKEGLELLSQAEASGFQNLSLLKQSAQRFLKAQQGNQRDVRPYLFVAYVFLLLDDPMRASTQLNLARRQDPEHPLIREFSEKLLELSKIKKTQTPKKPSQKSLDFSKDQDPEKLYDYLHQVILLEVRQLQAIIPPKTDAPIEEQEHFAGLIQQAQQNFEQIQAQLHALNVHMDTYELKSRLRPLEIVLNHCKKINGKLLCHEASGLSTKY